MTSDQIVCRVANQAARLITSGATTTEGGVRRPVSLTEALLLAVISHTAGEVDLADFAHSLAARPVSSLKDWVEDFLTGSPAEVMFDNLGRAFIAAAAEHLIRTAERYAPAYRQVLANCARRHPSQFGGSVVATA